MERFEVRLEADEAERLRREADKRGATVSGYIRTCITEGLRHAGAVMDGAVPQPPDVGQAIADVVAEVESRIEALIDVFVTCAVSLKGADDATRDDMAAQAHRAYAKWRESGRGDEA